MANKKQDAPLSLPKELPLLPVRPHVPGKLRKKGSRAPNVSKHRCTAEERRFCALVVTEGKSYADAGREIGYSSDWSGSELAARPRVAKLLAQLQEKAEQKFIERQAEKLALSLEKADDRLGVMLSRPSLDEERMALTINLGRTKAGIEFLKEKGMLDKAPSEEPSIGDFALLKAIELCYKRKGGYPTSTAGAAFMQQINASKVQVYQASWMDKKPAALEPPKPDGEGNGS